MATKTAFRHTHRWRGGMAVNRIAVMLLCAGLLLAGCAKEKRSSVTYYAMGTICTLDIYGGEEILAESQQLMNQLDRKLSWRTEGSDIWNLNQKGSGEVDEDTAEVVRQALEVSRLTGGAFDPTLGIITREWNFKEGILPAEETIAEKLPMVDWEQVEVGESSVTMGQGQALDLGGIAKGYAADRIRALMREQGVASGVINLGGNVYIIGKRPDGVRYRVGIRDPGSSAGNAYCSIEVEDKAVVISGPYEQNFEENGQTYHHILNPGTGYPAKTGLESVCIVADSSALADGLSTAVFVLGEEKGLELVESMEGVEAMMLNDRGEIVYSSGFDQYSPKILVKNYVEKS